MLKNLLRGGISLSVVSAIGIGAVAGAAWGVAPAHAQDGAPVEASSGSAGLDEITVTARRREESLQDTPISISAFNGDDLQDRGVKRLDEISGVAPNLVIKSTAAINSNSAAATIFIRGIGQPDFLHTTDPGVGVYVDGVYVTRSIGGLLDLLDIERIEILRGPQGTLFGKNTIGGAINITTLKPNDEFSGRLNATTGSFDRIDVGGAVNIPLSDNVYSYFSVNYQSRDPYVENLLPDGPGLGDIDALSARGALRILGGERLVVDLTVDATRRRENPAPFVLAGYDPANQFVLASGEPFTDTYLAGPFNTYSSFTAPSAAANSLLGFPLSPISNTDVFGGSLTISYDFDAFTVKSISSARYVDSQYAGDLDHSPVNVFQNLIDWEDESYSQELQAFGNLFDERLDWLVGAYFSAEEGSMRDLVTSSLVGIYSGGETEVTSLAVFAQGTYAITDWISATAGVRWTEDDKTFFPDQYLFESLIPPLPAGTRVLPFMEVENSFVNISPYFNLSARPADNVMLYASYSEGFKSGGFGQRIFPPLGVIPTFKPETARVYEVGAKTRFFDNKVQANAAVFHTSYDELQVNVLAAGNLTLTTENAAAATIKGFELEMTALPVEGLQVQANVGYTDASYDELSASAMMAGLTLSHEFVNAPEWTVSAAASYDFEFAGGHILTPRIEATHTSSVENSALNEALQHQEAFTLVNAYLTFVDASGQWRVSIGGRNITDEEYITSGRTNSGTGLSENAYGRPAEWVLELGWRF